MNWYLEVLKKYAVFDGRARRKEYWFFVLFNVIIAFVLGIIDAVIGSSVGDGGVGVLGGIYSLAVLIPSIAVAVRRLHDTDRTGWWVLISFVPFVGWIILLVLLVFDGTPGPNKYGVDPKGRGAAAAATHPVPPQPPAASWSTPAPPASTTPPPAAPPASTTAPPAPAESPAPPQSAQAPPESPPAAEPAPTEEPSAAEPQAPPSVSPPTPPPLTPLS